MSDESTNTRKRIIYAEDRSTLDLEYYREGFIGGYGAGAEAAIEYALLGYFGASYNDHYSPESHGFGFEEDQGIEVSLFQKLSYRIGYSDAYDDGYSQVLRSLQSAWESNAKRIDPDGGDEPQQELFTL
jgi:hypothetical protein